MNKLKTKIKFKFEDIDESDLTSLLLNIEEEKKNEIKIIINKKNVDSSTRLF